MLPKGIFQQSHIVPHIGKHLRGVPIEQNEGGGGGARSIRYEADIAPRFGNVLGGIGFIGGRAHQIRSGGAIGTEGVGHGGKTAVGGELFEALPVAEPDAQIGHRCGAGKDACGSIGDPYRTGQCMPQQDRVEATAFTEVHRPDADRLRPG